ncbi:MAG: protein-disulfide reductase DsbD family protein [Bacteroidota bacterium]
MKKVFLLSLLITSFLAGQPADPVTVSMAAKTISAAPGGKFRATLVVTMHGEWHINSHRPNDPSLIPSRIRATGEGVTLKEAGWPQPHDVTFAFSDEPVSVFDGTIEIPLTFTAASTAAGKQTVTVRFDYQACDNSTCLPPTSVTATFDVTFTGAKSSESKKETSLTTPTQTDSGSDKTETQPAEESTEVSAPLQEYAGAPQENSLEATFESGGLAVALLVIFLGGLALNLTPCVYPLIPITIGYFGGQSEGKTSRLFMMGLLYMLGMALTYSVIGVITSLSGALFGTLLQNMYVIIAIAALFVVLSLSQFGVYEFNLPSSWMAAAGGAKGGLFGAFFMGLTMGIVAAPCIGPFVIGLVTYVAAQGDPFQGFLMFFVLAIGLGLPYMILALFSGKIKQLPRSGEWMEGVKHIFGFLMLAMALYFIEPILPKSIQPFMLPGFGIIAAAILLLIDKKGDGVKGFRIFKMIFSLFVITVSTYALIPAEKKSPDWKVFSESQYEISLKNNERMIIDFYADWCIPCKELDALTFSDSDVIDEMKRFTAYKADLTQSGSPENESLTKRFRIRGVPTILIIDEQGNEIERITGFVNAETFLQKIRSVN